MSYEEEDTCMSYEEYMVKPAELLQESDKVVERC